VRAAAVAAAVIVGAGGFAVWWGCSVYDPSLLLPAADGAPPPDVGVEAAGDDGGADAPGPCALVRVPPRPAMSDPSDADITVICAIHTLDVGLRDDGGPVPLFGYDLDNTFTCCSGAPDSCKSPVNSKAHCDEDSGRDNSGGQLLRSFAEVSNGAISADTISSRIQAGQYSLIGTVSHYNGQPNDSNVIFALYASGGTVGPDGGAQQANWDGNDVWSIDQSYAAGPSDSGPPVPSHFDTSGYVANGTMVSFIDVPLALGSNKGSVAVTLTGGIVTGKLVPEKGTFRIDEGQISGRWKVTNLLQALHAVGAPFSSGYICPGTSAYSTVKLLVCEGSDITADPTLDNMGATCDALSLAFGFTAYPALTGPIVPDVTQNVGCPEAGPDQCP
jgi:hypothetical protein